MSALVVEVLAALTGGCGRARDAAALAWKGLLTVFPRGYGTGYSHLDGVFGEGLKV